MNKTGLNTILAPPHLHPVRHTSPYRSLPPYTVEKYFHYDPSNIRSPHMLMPTHIFTRVSYALHNWMCPCSCHPRLDLPLYTLYTIYHSLICPFLLPTLFSRKKSFPTSQILCLTHIPNITPSQLRPSISTSYL